MKTITALMQHPLFQRIVMMFALAGIILIGATLWLAEHDRRLKDETIAVNDAKWKKKLEEARKVTVTDTNWIDVPAKKPTTTVSPAHGSKPKPQTGTITTPAPVSSADSTAYFKAVIAEKDSIIEYYSQDRHSDPIEDSLQTHQILFTPQGSFGIPPMSFVLSSTPKPQKAMQINSHTLGYIPEEVPWYCTKEAYFVYGIIATSATVYGVRQLTR